MPLNKETKPRRCYGYGRTKGNILLLNPSRKTNSNKYFFQIRQNEENNQRKVTGTD